LHAHLAIADIGGLGLQVVDLVRVDDGVFAAVEHEQEHAGADRDQPRQQAPAALLLFGVGHDGTGDITTHTTGASTCCNGTRQARGNCWARAWGRA
jgi:hypothetical protein